MRRAKQPLNAKRISIDDAFFQLSHRTLSRDISLHRHSFFELELLVKGEAYQTINGTDYHSLPGSCCLLSPSDHHSIQVVSPIEILNLSFNEAMLSQEQLKKVVIDKALLFHRFQAPQLDVIEDLFRLCIKAFALSPQDPACLNMLVSCLLAKVLSCHAPSATQPVSGPAAPVQAALLFIHTHFHESPTLAQAAGIAHYNASYFSTVFRKEFGISYSEYLTKVKLDYAKRLLLSTHLSIEKICQQSGFSSPSTFLQAFKKHVGTTPTEFRTANW